jgi:hypothetical protein
MSIKCFKKLGKSEIKILVAIPESFQNHCPKKGYHGLVYFSKKILKYIYLVVVMMKVSSTFKTV